MVQELELALKQVKIRCHYKSMINDPIDFYLDIIEQSLFELKAIKEIEEIKTLRRFNEVELNNDENVNKSLDIIEQALIEMQKQKKVLKVMFEKEVNMLVFNQCEDVETYNKVYIKQKDRQLTQEEFDLLKEYVK